MNPRIYTPKTTSVEGFHFNPNLREPAEVAQAVSALVSWAKEKCDNHPHGGLGICVSFTYNVRFMSGLPDECVVSFLFSGHGVGLTNGDHLIYNRNEGIERAFTVMTDKDFLRDWNAAGLADEAEPKPELESEQETCNLMWLVAGLAVGYTCRKPKGHEGNHYDSVAKAACVQYIGETVTEYTICHDCGLGVVPEECASHEGDCTHFRCPHCGGYIEKWTNNHGRLRGDARPKGHTTLTEKLMCGTTTRTSVGHTRPHEQGEER